jgi:hypothetical protein
VSSSRSCNVFDAGSSSFIHLEPAEDFIAEAPTERPDCFCLGVAGGLAFGNVRLSWSRASELGDGNPVEGDIELTVAAAVEPMTNQIA